MFHMQRLAAKKKAEKHGIDIPYDEICLANANAET